MQGEELSTWIARVEMNLEAGRLEDARRLLADAEAALGSLPRLAQLRQRIAEVENLATPQPAAELTRRARQEIDRANYDQALALLRQALQLQPDDPDLQSLLQQAEKAAARHSAAQARHRAILDVASEIGQLIEAQKIPEARARLQEAGIEFGRHDALIQLQQRLALVESQAAEHRALELEQRVAALYEANNWRGVLQETELLLRLAPGHERAQQMQLEARQNIDRQESRRHHRSAIETTRQDIDRLITARELNSASQKLQEAIYSLGNDPAFEELQQRIHSSRSDLQFRKRVEWAERRANEAERLIQEANRLSLQGSFDDAIQRLESAQELDPSHPDIPDKLATAYAARDRQNEERRRFEDLMAQLQDIQHHLDALRLDQAATLIQQTGQNFDAEERLAPLLQRLDKLRAAERAGARLSQLNADQVSPGETISLLRDQRDVWNAYSWKQALLYPLRGHGINVLAALVTGLIVLDVLAVLPWIGNVFRLLRGAAPWLLLGLAPLLSRTTVGGQNHMPSWGELFEPKRWTKDSLRMFGLSLLLLIPAVLWIVGRAWHGQLSANSGPLGWGLVGLLLWPAGALGIIALGATATFGEAQTYRLGPHLQALLRLPSTAILIGHGAFITMLILVLLRTAAVPLLPWLAIPLQAALEAYAFLALPHVVGSLMRRRGVDLAPLYS